MVNVSASRIAKIRVLVTGAAGFIGGYVSEALTRLGHEVAAVDDLSGGYRGNIGDQISLLELDLRDPLETERRGYGVCARDRLPLGRECSRRAHRSSSHAMLAIEI